MDDIAIIMPAYNAEKYIEQTINSVLMQTYKNWKLYIIDDNSVDDTVKLINRYIKDDSRIELLKLDRNVGQAKARNIGIDKCNERYLTFLDSDDIWNNNFLENQLRFMNKNNYELVFSAFERRSEDLSECYGYLDVPEKIEYKDLLKNNYLSCLTTIIDTKRIGKIYFEEGYKHEDHIMWIKILKDYIKYAYGNNEVLAIYRIRKGSTSRNKIRAAKWKWNIYRKYLKFNIAKTIYYYFHYAYRGIVKNIKFIS